MASAQQDPSGLAVANTARVPDAMRLLPPNETRLGGLLGDRFVRNERNRLLKVDEEELLAGFRHRPGKQAWIGEHVGKFLHAASLAYANTGDPSLRAKIDRVAAELMKTQEPDGYLGTYVPSQRFGLYPNADWDVWVHKYDLLGLLTYHQYTGNTPALQACRRIGDLLINTFGPGKKSINSAGTHEGMAATSVLEPMVLLYRATADGRYLSFAKYLVSAWEEPNGPHILTTLLREKSVRKTANAKAYEMLSNLVGLCELYRATGDRDYLQAVLNAWTDVSRNRLYITGSGSSYEHWQDEYHLPNGNSADICETCVTVTWEQLNLELLRLTGEPRFVDQLERTVYNHLLGAQKPTGDDWCYYTPLQGVKPYDSATTCCHSSGPRGVALLPTFVYTIGPYGLNVNLYTPSHVSIPIKGGSLEIEQKTDFPTDGIVDIVVTPQGEPNPVEMINLRVPAWSQKTSISVNGKPINADLKPGTYYGIARNWKAGDRIRLNLDMTPRLVLGDHENAGKAAVMVGPLVLAADEGHNPSLKPLVRHELAESDPAGFRASRSRREPPSDLPVYYIPLTTTSYAISGNPGTRLAIPSVTTAAFIPFYAAGADGSRFEVWIPRKGTLKASTSLLMDGEESRSLTGNQSGSIIDGDPETIAVTFDGTKQDEAWFSVTLPTRETISRVVFCHGQSFHDGGWFDTSAGKPRIQVKRGDNWPWEDVAILDSYPDSTPERAGRGLQPGAGFAVKFPAVTVRAVRVIGKPACGDNASQSFASCGELQAFLDK